ncbi:PAS domain-containing sensor histidine kinase [Psychrobacter sp. M13]|uniref:sensor histidine kinase n=1 Tax=Psychrobacter sp. M13 TaxID=3067275 RepID=UPI00273C6A66|nr:HAMP domain-containing sensor histidine kinase [Psychrobacter sp. M13]WLP95264.1 HAMP domain-containing sensor histidine kinase [Psychrobacter sp. M13]
MKPASTVIAFVITYLQQGETLPSAQLRRLGMVYNSYRLIVSLFLLLMIYVTTQADNSIMLPSLLQLTILIFYVLFSLILFGLFSVVPQQPRRQLLLGLFMDVVVLSLLLYTNGAPDLQLTMLYMVVVAASFMLLTGTQALIITLLAIIFIIYQQFFHAIANSMNLADLGDALLISASFLAVGFLSWSVSQRLVHVEGMALQQALEVAHLNAINQEVVSQMINGIIVVDKKRIVLANLAAYQLLGIESDPAAKPTFSFRLNQNVSTTTKPFNNNKKRIIKAYDPLIDFQKKLTHEHKSLVENYINLANNQLRTFIYDLPKSISATNANKLRIQIIPLKDNSQLMLLEDLRREQTSAQQLKLASLGQLTASIAHEIRNPLAAISQASQLLIEDIDENYGSDDTESSMTTDNTGNHELYKMIFAQTKRVDRIIEDVLKLSRQQQPQRQTIELIEWMPQFLDNHFRNHDITLNVRTTIVIQFDTHQLEQIFINLINNGLRYSSRAHTQADVTVEIYDRQNDVIIDVLDTGIGIDNTSAEHLFEPFFTTDKAGTGLGLYLSQAFSEANYAQLIHVPEHAKTCFRLIVPAAVSIVEIA